jgi:hypothetical protein
MRGNAAALKKSESEVLLVPDHKVTPGSFLEALAQGWKVISENTVLGVDKRHRHGKVFLQMEGRSERLAIEYTGTVKQGYHFGPPQLLN